MSQFSRYVVEHHIINCLTLTTSAKNCSEQTLVNTRRSNIWTMYANRHT